MTAIEKSSPELTTTRTDDGNHTTWAVADATRATSLTIARGTPEQITRMIEVAPSAAGFADENTASVLQHVSNHERIDNDRPGGSMPCPHLGRCDRDTWDRHSAHPLFQAAAAAGFDDARVYELLTELHHKAGA